MCVRRFSRLSSVVSLRDEVPVKSNYDVIRSASGPREGRSLFPRLRVCRTICINICNYDAPAGMAGRINGSSNGNNNKEREKEEEMCERKRESARQVLLDGTYRKNNARTRGNRSV